MYNLIFMEARNLIFMQARNLIFMEARKLFFHIWLNNFDLHPCRNAYKC